MHRIGEDRSQRLDIVPAELRMIVTIRLKNGKWGVRPTLLRAG